jgi:hypothetical protein
MSTPAPAAPAPFFRPTPINSPRAGGARAPRLGLAIPGSAPAANGPAGRRGPPSLKLATPGNTNNMMGPPEHRRTGSITNAVPTSAATQYSALSFAMGLRNQVRGSPDAANATNGNGSLNGLDTKVNENVNYDSMDVEELPVEGWEQARETGRIIELGSLGEGAGGAVTRCTLRGGKTIFALKVCPFLVSFSGVCGCGAYSRCRSSQQIQHQKSKNRYFGSSTSTGSAHHHTSANTTEHSKISLLGRFQSPWNSARVAVWTVYTAKSRN